MQQNQINIEQILENLNIKELNLMQLAAIEASKSEKDLVLLSETGSGKTLAFLIPILNLIDNNSKQQTQAMIIVPSRELAIQIDSVLRQMGTGYKITCCYGGHKRETEENNLVEPPIIIIGTPGRLSDHIRRGNISINTIKILVMDEFDKLLELGFQDEISFITTSLKSIEKKILTSATSSLVVPPFLGLYEPIQLNFLNEESRNEKAALEIVISPNKDKVETLFQLLCVFNGRSAIVFCNHRESVERTSDLLRQKGIYNEFYHGAMEQQERDSALCKFRNGSTNVLITTDLASRGLDIPNIRYIVHFHLPHTEEIFIHRNGRTARMEASGTSILILSEEEKVPAYITEPITQICLPNENSLPEKPKWVTLFIAAGKKDKVNKVDIVGFLSNKGHLKKEDIGLIEVKDFFAFVAIRKTKIADALQLIKNEKIKNKKVKIEIAK